MNYQDASTDIPVGQKPADRKSNLEGEDPGQSGLDRAAMEGAQKGQDRMHKNEQTNSSNTIFSK